MPAPGPGGTQSSLASKVAWLTRLFRASNAAQSNSKPTPRDITSLQTIFSRPMDADHRSGRGHRARTRHTRPDGRWPHGTWLSGAGR
jgi:hypothetical protein